MMKTKQICRTDFGLLISGKISGFSNFIEIGIMMAYKHVVILFSLLTLAGLKGMGQPDADQKKQEQAAQLKSWIESKKFSFHAISATSMKGRTRQLTGEYFLKIDNDNLQVFLPYYGRSYTTSYPPTDLSVEFNTTDFIYEYAAAKKSGWDIDIKPKNQTSASRINLSVTSSGYCTVRVQSNSREPISYYGTISQ